MNNFENNQNKENQWNNIEKKNTNWFKEKWESIKNFLEWKKHVDEIQVKEEIRRKAEDLKDSAIDSTLDNLNLDMQEWLELQDSDDKTKEELNNDEKIFIDSLNKRSIIIFNKSDLKQVTREINSPCEKIFISAKNLTGIQELKALIYKIACEDSLLSSGLNTSAGQLKTLTNALDSLKESRESLINSMGEDITAGLMNSARLDLLRVLGLDAGDELLDSMFSRFCVGK